MEKIKEIVVSYLTKQIEMYGRINQINVMPEKGKMANIGELRYLMGQTYPYADENKLKKILFSEPQLNALVLMVNLAIEVWQEENPTTKIVDSARFVEKIIISVLNGVFNPALKGAVKYV